ncbi:hypothetical protein ACO2Q2_13375 [Dyella sp. KRB-257]|uniref:hypothetical protein n=1 Tax=Dyella sp. KRB-257 TaxID=3400915 RepID=UPI003BFBBBE6
MTRLAKIPLYGNVAKAVTVNLDATEGAQIGNNLLMPDGTLATTAKLQALFGAGISGSGPDTTDALDEGQFNLYFTNRRAQDAVGGILADSTNVSLTYVGGTSITADLTDLADTGAGALLAITRDAKGRVTGTKAATITGTAGQIDIADGDAAAGLPTISLASAVLSQLSALAQFQSDLLTSSNGSPLVTSGGDFITTSAA